MVRYLDRNQRFLPFTHESFDRTKADALKAKLRDIIVQQLQENEGELQTKPRQYSRSSIARKVGRDVTNAELFTQLRFLDSISEWMRSKFKECPDPKVSQLGSGQAGQIVGVIRLVLEWLMDDSSGCGGYLPVRMNCYASEQVIWLS